MNPQKGIFGGQYSPLTNTDIETIHSACLRIFSEVGFKVSVKEGRQLFREAGAEVDEATAVVKVSPDLAMELIGRAPSEVTLCGRAADAQLDCVIGGKSVYMGTGGTALNVQEPGSTERRQSKLADIAGMAKAVNALDNIHFYMLNVYPHDVPEKNVDVNRFTAALNRTDKHVIGGVYTVSGIDRVVKIAEMIAGSPKALRERPFISMVTCVISPLVIDSKYGKLCMEVAKRGIPLAIPSEPLCGATAPITLAGNVLVWVADTLAGVMLAQLVNPGTPVLAGCVASITDMRDLKYLSGAVEMGLLNAAAAQMAHYYKLPIYTTAGMSDAKTVDAQAGYESAITSLLVALAGGNLIHDAAGFIEFCLTASYDKLVMDNEIIGMVMRAVQGIEVNEKTLGFDLIKEAGPGGHFVSSRHTRRFMRRELYAPSLSDREDREKWTQAGSLDALARATEKAKAILEAKTEPMIPKEIRDRIKAEIKGVEPFILD